MVQQTETSECFHVSRLSLVPGLWDKLPEDTGLHGFPGYKITCTITVGCFGHTCKLVFDSKEKEHCIYRI